MTGTPYPYGNPVVLDLTIEDGTTPEDPATLIFRVRKPDATLTTYTYGTDPQVTRLATGLYECDLGVPALAGQYHYEGVTTNPDSTSPGEFFVMPSSVDAPAEAPGPVMGPCRTWINGEDIVNCAGFDPAVDTQLLDAVAVEASQLLWELSGRQFTGTCDPVTVRPTRPSGCNHWWGDFAYGGYTWVWLDSMGAWAWTSENGDILTGCGSLSRVKLNGYPVREITEVKIDGAVLDTTYDDGAPTYRLDGWRWLTRMNDPAQLQLQKAWPACQNLALNDDQPGTFSVTYRYGVDPPASGISAAIQLACQLALAGSGKPCQLPIGTTKIVKTGVTIERGVLTSWARDPKTGAWMTGLALVDAFLNTWNRRGLRRRPAVLSPDTQAFAQRLGEQGN